MYAVIPGPQKVWAGSVSSHTPVHTLSFISSVWKEKNKKKTQQFKKRKRTCFLENDSQLTSQRVRLNLDYQYIWVMPRQCFKAPAFSDRLGVDFECWSFLNTAYSPVFLQFLPFFPPIKSIFLCWRKDIDLCHFFFFKYNWSSRLFSFISKQSWVAYAARTFSGKFKEAAEGVLLLPIF